MIGHIQHRNLVIRILVKAAVGGLVVLGVLHWVGLMGWA